MYKVFKVYTSLTDYSCDCYYISGDSIEDILKWLGEHVEEELIINDIPLYITKKRFKDLSNKNNWKTRFVQVKHMFSNKENFILDYYCY